MINETKQDLENLQADLSELDDLRIMRQDIQRQEKANAELISSQAKRLEELETLYKEEQACPHMLCSHSTPWLPSLASLPACLSACASRTARTNSC
jgi:hypothetical protein